MIRKTSRRFNVKSEEKFIINMMKEDLASGNLDRKLNEEEIGKLKKVLKHSTLFKGLSLFNREFLEKKLQSI